MKLNNKGFAITSIVYAILLVFMLLITATLLLLSNRDLYLKKIKDSVFDKYSITDDWMSPIINIEWNNMYIPNSIDFNSYEVNYLKGISAVDSSGMNVSNITYQLPNNYNPKVAGTYTITYTATDLKGISSTKEATIVVSNIESRVFSYAGEEQLLTLPVGSYMFEVWGAQGGNGYVDTDYQGIGGLGGYSKGIIELNKITNFYVNVGGRGLDNRRSSLVAGGFNGGGAGNVYGGSGGGATDIRMEGNTLGNRIIVAGGGGGGESSLGNVNNVAHGGLGGGANRSGEDGMCESAHSGDYNYPGIGAGISSSPTKGMYESEYNNFTYLGTVGNGGGGIAISNIGGGGGGYYGGSSGGYLYNSGGGGSGYANVDLFSYVYGTSGVRNGNGYAVITYLPFYD